MAVWNSIGRHTVDGNQKSRDQLTSWSGKYLMIYKGFFHHPKWLALGFRPSTVHQRIEGPPILWVAALPVAMESLKNRQLPDGSVWGGGCWRSSGDLFKRKLDALFETRKRQGIWQEPTFCGKYFLGFDVLHLATACLFVLKNLGPVKDSMTSLDRRKRMWSSSLKGRATWVTLDSKMSFTLTVCISFTCLTCLL